MLPYPAPGCAYWLIADKHQGLRIYSLTDFASADGASEIKRVAVDLAEFGSLVVSERVFIGGCVCVSVSVEWGAQCQYCLA
jgi:hypothetical protein